MKNLLFIFVLCLSPYLSFAAISGPITSPDFSYQVQEHPNLAKEIDSFLAANDHFFIERELNQIHLPQGFAETKLSLSLVNRIYSGDLGNTIVLIKAGVIPSNLQLIETSVQIENGFLHHFKQANGLVVAVFVVTNEWDNAEEIFTGLKEKITSIHKPHKSSFDIIGTAYADDCALPGDSSAKEIRQLVSIGSKLPLEASPMQHLTSCAMAALQGTWNASGGTLVSMGKTISAFIAHPIESGKKFWESATKLLSVTKRFQGDFESQARQLFSSFDALDPLMKTKLACEVIGTIGGGILLSYLTAGSGTAEILLKIKKALGASLKLSKFSHVKKALAVRSAKIVKVNNELKKNLFNVKRGLPGITLKKNSEVLTALNNHPMKALAPRKASFTNNEIQKLFRQVSDHPVASLSKVDRFSKANPEMGYSFGKATSAHIKALNNGIDETAVRKVWAVGDLQTGASKWRYHVTTVVRDSNGKWQAIDPVFGKPMPVDQWYAKMKKFDSKGDMRIFNTEAKRFGPDMATKYNSHKHKHPDYENYFEDLMEVYRKESHELSLQKSAVREN